MFDVILNTFGIAQAHAAVYVLDSSGTTSLGGAATDVANSLYGTIVSLVPVLIPLIVVGFAIGLLKSFFHKRG